MIETNELLTKLYLLLEHLNVKCRYYGADGYLEYCKLKDEMGFSDCDGEINKCNLSSEQYKERSNK